MARRWGSGALFRAWQLALGRGRFGLGRRHICVARFLLTQIRLARIKLGRIKLAGSKLGRSKLAVASLAGPRGAFGRGVARRGPRAQFKHAYDAAASVSMSRGLNWKLRLCEKNSSGFS